MTAMDPTQSTRRSPRESKSKSSSTSQSTGTNPKETVAPNSISDQPTAQDTLGFNPYVEALAEFLTHEQTKPPLVVSIEGPWGSGKSSFMLQLENLIKQDGSATLWFNAWRYEKEESLWAAFALQFTSRLAQTVSFWPRLYRHLKILWLRYDLRKGWFNLAKFVLLTAVFVFIGFVAIRHLYQYHDLQVFISSEGHPQEPEKLLLTFLLRLGGVAAYILIGFLLLKKISDTIGNPLGVDLKRFIQNPKYDEHVDFIETFHADFNRIVKTYAANRRVFVFVDDLDRCEIPKAAELMQALNLLISDSAPIFYILGLDRQKIAAGLAAKFEKLLPYLYGKTKTGEISGTEFGLSYIEKFIQIPFQIPHPALRDIDKLLDSLQSGGISVPPESNTRTPTDRGLLVELGTDSSTVRDVVEMVAPCLDFNPRRIKQFVNLFRLRALLAGRTGLFGPPTSQKFDRLTMHQLGKITAVGMSWPALIVDLESNPGLLSELQNLAGSRPPLAASAEAENWAKQPKLMKLIAYRVPNDQASSTSSTGAPTDGFGPVGNVKYNLSKVDVERVLKIAPALDERPRRGGPEPVATNAGQPRSSDESKRQIWEVVKNAAGFSPFKRKTQEKAETSPYEGGSDQAR